MTRKLIRNSIRTPDGTTLVSRHRHHFVCHNDTSNGKRYCLDGGLSYSRFIGDIEDCEDTSLYDDDPHMLLREAIEWGRITNGEHEYVKIKNMSKAHINAIIEDGYKGVYVELMERELIWRRDNEFTDLEDRLEKAREDGYD